MADEREPHDRELDAYREYLHMLARLHLGARLRASSTLPMWSSRRCSKPTSAGSSSGAALRPERDVAAADPDHDARGRGQTLRRRQAQCREGAVARGSTGRSRPGGLRPGSPPTSPLPASGPTGRSNSSASPRHSPQLPRDQRTALEMKHLQGMPVAEIAVRMGRGKRAIVGLLFRGLKKLRELLDERE